MTNAPSRLSELIQLEQLCFAYARKHGLRSSDWVNEVKLWILRQASFEKPPPSRSRPAEEVRAASRERSDRADRNTERIERQRDEWKREKEADPEALAKAREECLSRFARRRPAAGISLDAWVDRKVASA